ncbi:MAG: DCL family protein [Verrucomicrobia bacterium]|nr:DCL family protein [Verrucomicrobiota bacterium]
MRDKMPPFNIGNRRFRTKSSALEELRRILNGAPIGEPITGDDGSLVADLLYDGRHPEAAEKIGVGVDYIEVRPASYHTRCFWIVRTDGSEADFSMMTAMNGQPSAKARVSAALREEVRDEVEQHRHSLPDDVACALCGSMTSPESAYMTYLDPTFDQIATTFVDNHGGWQNIAEERVGPYGRKLSNRDLAEDWARFHRTNARLFPAHPVCNLSRHRGPR